MADFEYMSNECRSFLKNAGIDTEKQLFHVLEENEPGWLSQMDGMTPLLYGELRDYFPHNLKELKPCPFCGGSAWVVWDISGKEVYVRCKSCSATVGAYLGNGVRYSNGAINIKQRFPYAKKKDREVYAVWHIVNTWNSRT